MAYTSEDLSKSQNKIQPHLKTITIYYHKTEQKLDNIKNSVVESSLKLLTLVCSPLAVKLIEYIKGNPQFIRNHNLILQGNLLNYRIYLLGH